MGQRVKRHELRHIQQRRRQSDVNAAKKQSEKKQQKIKRNFRIRCTKFTANYRASSAVAGAGAGAGARRCQLI